MVYMSQTLLIKEQYSVCALILSRHILSYVNWSRCFISYLALCSSLFICKLLRIKYHELIFLLSVTRNFVALVRRGFIFLLVLRIGCVILLWHSLGLRHYHFGFKDSSLVLIVPFAGHCLHFTSISLHTSQI